MVWRVSIPPLYVTLACKQKTRLFENNMYFIDTHYLANEHCARIPKVGLSSERKVVPCEGRAAPPPPIFGHRRAPAAAADFLVGEPPTQYIEVSIFSWTVL